MNKLQNELNDVKEQHRIDMEKHQTDIETISQKHQTDIDAINHDHKYDIDTMRGIV